MPSGKEEKKNESSDLENEDKGITERTAWANTANHFFYLFCLLSGSHLARAFPLVIASMPVDFCLLEEGNGGCSNSHSGVVLVHCIC